jgi:hypothetical protein
MTEHCRQLAASVNHGGGPAAAAASIRHEDTSYDRLLMSGVPRADARARVRDEVHSILEKWQATTAS